MSVWAIADLHLSFGVSNKSMDVFGGKWINHAANIEKNWRATVQSDDLVLLAGDISWATSLEEVAFDLAWLESLPGTKVMIKGNHDYWWHSLSKVKKILPPSCHVIQNDTFEWNDFSIGGTRLWDSQEYSFKELFETKGDSRGDLKPQIPEEDLKEQERIFERELSRLETSLKALNQNAKMRLVMTHYPPIGLDLKPSRASLLFEKYHVDMVIFGHLHNVKNDRPLFGQNKGVRYFLTACDYLDLSPLKLI